MSLFTVISLLTNNYIIGRNITWLKVMVLFMFKFVGIY